MGVIEHSDVIENAVTLGGGGGGAALDTANTWTAPQTFSAATAAVLVFPAPTSPTGPLSAIIVAPSVPTGGAPAAGFGSSVDVQLPADTGSYYTAGALTVSWLDATEATAASALAITLTRAGVDFRALAIRPEGLELTLIPAPSGNPPADTLWIYADAADSHLKKKLSNGTVVDLG